MHRRWKCHLRNVTLTLTCALTFMGHANSQDVGSFLAGLLGAAEIPLNDTDNLQDQVPCPGECVHALTSILCSRVIEQFNCGASYLRCCVSSDFNFGTVVETSAPLPEETSTETSTEYELFLITTTPYHEITTNYINETTSSPSSFTTTLKSPTSKPGNFHQRYTTTPKPQPPCKGICVENIFVRYCGSTISGWCETGSTCCASSQDEDEQVEASTLPVVYSTQEPKGDKSQTMQHRPIDTSTVSSQPPAPVCPGSCVAPLFSLLCDSVVDNYYCPNDGRCCISNDDYNSDPITTTTARPQVTNPCPGACIPIFLRGMCNRPSEVLIRSDCDQDFVCCYQPDVKDHLHIETPQIPLLRPGPPKPVYPNGLHPSQGNRAPMFPPQIPNPYNQRPQNPYPPNPAPPSVLVPHIQNQQSGSSNNRPGYPPVPHPPSNKVTPINKHPYSQNTNFANIPQEHHFPNRPNYYNASLEIHPVRQTITTPENEQHFYDMKIRNNTHFGMPLRPNNPAQQPSTEVKRDPQFIYPSMIQNPPQSPPPEVNRDSPFINPPIIQNPRPVMQPDEYTVHRQQNNNPNRFISSSIGFDSDKNRPTVIDFNKPLEKFQPPIIEDQPISLPGNYNPINDSKSIVNHPHPPVELMEKIPEHSVEHSSETVGTSFIPIQESFRPIQNQQKPQNPKQTLNVPIIAGAQTIQIHKPTIPDNSFSNVSVDEIKQEQSKKLKPECPGSCIGTFLRFTCFGSSAIYDGFKCDPDGTLCCTSVEHIQKYEEHIKSGNPLVLVKPDEGSKLEDSSNTRRPGMYVCGIKGNQRRKTGRVVGGKTSVPGEWCWQVALINAKNQYLCGGALIGSRWVLTAAHCITALVRNGDAIYVRVGDFDLASQYGTPGAQTQKVSTSYIHHNHNGQTLDNDVALLRLENPVQLQETVCLACLPARNAESPPGTRCTVTGYGYMNEGGPVALKIREAVLPIVEEQLCTEQINKVTEKRFILPAGSFCAGGETGNDACQGDGGGPLTCVNEGYHELTGLVSWGFGCGKKDVPGVYVKVSSYIGWINQIISVNN